jgi:glycine/D-amino acid oxidase-like deaminating enzyme
MGCCTALLLARRGVEVVLFDREQELLRGAGRWNEGKIHLGFLYSGDRGLHTAKELLTGGLLFRPIVEELLETRLGTVTSSPDLYLVHKDSIVSAEDTGRYFKALTEMVRQHPLAGRYLEDVRLAVTTQLGSRELGGLVDASRFQAGFSTPEKSVCTQEVADSLAAAVHLEPLIQCRLGTEILGASHGRDAGRACYRLAASAAEEGSFTAVVNALWAGRPAIDQSLSLDNLYNPSLRYRLSLFVETDRVLDIPSAVICTGPFGDIKNYNGSRFYLSWYSSGLVYSSDDVRVPDAARLGVIDERGIIEDTFDNLTRHIPAVEKIRRWAKQVSVRGGWVFANGRGSLCDPSATVHRRDRVGIHQAGNWFSVDTGKYSIAPWLARDVTNRILGS